MPSDELDTGLWDYVKDGYHGKDGPLKRMIGLWLWWRTWAMMTVLVAGWIVTATQFGSTGSMWGFGIGAIAATIAREVGDRD